MWFCLCHFYLRLYWFQWNCFKQFNRANFDQFIFAVYSLCLLCSVHKRSNHRCASKKNVLKEKGFWTTTKAICRNCRKLFSKTVNSNEKTVQIIGKKLDFETRMGSQTIAKLKKGNNSFFYLSWFNQKLYKYIKISYAFCRFINKLQQMKKKPFAEHVNHNNRIVNW